MTTTFSYDDDQPEARHADTAGNVLQFHPRAGWHQGPWMWKVYNDSTHWIPLPARPCDVDPKDVMEERFKVWLGTFPPDSFDATAISFMRTGWNAGYLRAKGDR